VIGGLILAIALGPFITEKLGNTLGKTPPGILALLSGFSAEAVELILQRKVDILLAAVRGDDSAAIQAKAGAAAKAKTTKVEAALDNAIDAHADPAMSSNDVSDALKRVRGELAKPPPPDAPEDLAAAGPPLAGHLGAHQLERAHQPKRCRRKT
jgi:hypothetical protein